MLRSVSIRPPTSLSSGPTRPASEHWPSNPGSHRPMRASRLTQRDEQPARGDEAGTRPWSVRLGLAQGPERPPRARGELKVELLVRPPEIMAGYLADPPEPVLQGAAMYRKGPGGGVVVAAAVEVLAQGQDELGAVDRVVVDQRPEPLLHEAFHGRGVVRRRQDLVHAEAIEAGDLLGAADRLLDPQRELCFLVGAREFVQLGAPAA